jgi:hypothetical protein
MAEAIEQGSERRGLSNDDAWFDLGSRAHDADAVNVREPSQCSWLVGHAVLGTDDHDRRRRHATQLAQCLLGILALDCHQDDFVTAPADALEAVGGGYRQGQDARGRRQRQPLLNQDLPMFSAGDQHDIVAMLEQPPAHNSANGTGPEHDETHTSASRRRCA